MNPLDALNILRQVTDSVPLKRQDHQKVEEAYAALFEAVKPKTAMDGVNQKVATDAAG